MTFITDDFLLHGATARELRGQRARSRSDLDHELAGAHVQAGDQLARALRAQEVLTEATPPRAPPCPRMRGHGHGP